MCPHHIELPDNFVVAPEVAQAFRWEQPVVALESAVITHGLPLPENLTLAQQMEEEIRSQGATPATIAILSGQVHIGLTPSELKELSLLTTPTRKISRRDFGIALSRQENGGTTVAGTLIAARLAGIDVFATGGIGGVHRNAPFDISADLQELSHCHLVVVCAGAKAILDLPATVEVLESYGVPIIGYQTDELPAFYSAQSGLTVNCNAKTPQEIAQIAKSQWGLGLDNGILVVVPPPAEHALPYDDVNHWITQAIDEAGQNHITGAAVTPFLLSRVSELSGGASMRANLALLRNNARIATQIAVAIKPGRSAIT